MQEFEKPAYYLDLTLSSNRDHVERAKPDVPIEVLVRNDLRRDDAPIKATGVRRGDDFIVTVIVGSYTQTHSWGWEILVAAIGAERREAKRQR
jgi:hypothetical protein